MSNLTRSSGAVRVLAAAPASAPAAKSETSLGTKASKARGCFRSCSVVGYSLLSSLLSTETEAKGHLLSFFLPISVAFLLLSSSSSAVSTSFRKLLPPWGFWNPGMGRHVKTPSLISPRDGFQRNIEEKKMVFFFFSKG